LKLSTSKRQKSAPPGWLTFSAEEEDIIIHVPAAAATPTKKSSHREQEGTSYFCALFSMHTLHSLVTAEEAKMVTEWNTTMAVDHLLFHGEKANPL